MGEAHHQIFLHSLIVLFLPHTRRTACEDFMACWKHNPLFFLLLSIFFMQTSVSDMHISPFTCLAKIPQCNALLYRHNGYEKDEIASLYSVRTSEIKPISYADKQGYLVPVNCSCKTVNTTARYFYDVVYTPAHNDVFNNVSTQKFNGQVWDRGVDTNLTAGVNTSLHILCGCVDNETQVVVTYTIQVNDTISSIANLLSAEVDEIINLNNLTNYIEPGWILFVPTKKYRIPAPTKGTLAPTGMPPTLAPTGTPPAVTAAKGKTTLLGPILGSTIGVICVGVVIGTTVFAYRRRRKSEEVEEDCLDHVPGMSARFSFEELATATDNFNKKLGEGGFGSVFEGSLHDGTRIAVKQLDGVGHIKKSFLAEVETIGSIHHINLVKLIGFCAEKSHRLLVYEYMCNGSLDRWIYCRSKETCLGWNHRRQIILDIAKGLAYLHEECRQKIIHLDIKPQNILLDEHYNAKLADFGLSKLVERNQSKVVTTMRGTPGYLAPEWLSAVITEKVDVYSFGVVILEILCGRKIFEDSRPEEERHLPTLFMKKAEQGQWLDLVDRCCQDVESNVAEVEEMMRISAWCLQSDHEKRPSMSMVIKVLVGVKDVPNDIDYNFLIPQHLINKIPEVNFQDVTRLLPSVLSGPR